jgi:thiol-disulfide isomerase/thioredoxin
VDRGWKRLCARAIPLLIAGGLSCATEGPRVSGPALAAPLDLTLPTVQGEPLDLAALRGQVVVVDLMATWSMACQSEIRTFRRLLARYGGRGVRVVSIAMDAQTPVLVRTYVETLRIGWPVALASPDVIEGGSPLGRILEVPRTLILDRRGFVRFDHSGDLGEEALARAIAPLL